jgi:SAM-dependent methyltransferase
MDFPRLIAILEFERLVREHGISARKVLMLNGGAAGDPELQYLPHEQADFCDYDADPERYDLHALAVDREDYDFVLFSQTLEHLYNPVLALENVHRALADGGFVWTSVPTVSHQHQLPHHFSTGVTPIGLACLFAQTGFDVVAIGQWGNAKYVSHLFDLYVVPGLRDLSRGVQPRRGVRHALRLARRLSPLNLLTDGAHNDFAKPVQTWGLARKSSGESL